MTDRYPTRAGAAAGATGSFTVTLVKPGPGRGIMEHWAYDERGEALAALGLIAGTNPTCLRR